MKYGFIIDNRKCIGCHACTTACKSEHDVPIGVNRTWVKQVEKGEFPNTRRLFSVMRCNHCTDAPCVTICPTEALHYRTDGIVDFDNDRCIACKSCMQACPYDALYIDPENHTAAKCNYCAHRIDVGLEPACVNVCPEHAIISGDMDDPNSEISQLLARQPVKVRKPEKATAPNLFYIDADDVSLIPTETERSTTTMWGEQARGVGHYAQKADKMAFSNTDVVAELSSMDEEKIPEEAARKPKTIDVILGKAKQVYNSPDKGILWGWEVSGYVWTKAISAGIILIPGIAWLTGAAKMTNSLMLWSTGTALFFLAMTGLLLIKDLDRPDRFLYVLLRPHWTSWLVRGGYIISFYGAVLTLLLLTLIFDWPEIFIVSMLLAVIGAVLVAVYTAFLFAQAKGRDFWQSPTLSLHMLIHSVMAGAAAMLILVPWIGVGSDWSVFAAYVLIGGIVLNLGILMIEMVITHPTNDAKR
ncbi:MAG: 4Fe-4S dicluster domain-containing protein, partial [Saprospiraceae bacterium]|nr:4Fe-4S dicluster domain-containing protein [Saprospiraceae bacterium]